MLGRVQEQVNGRNEVTWVTDFAGLGAQIESEGGRHDQESERRVSGAVVKRPEYGRAVQDAGRSAKEIAAGGIFQEE